MQHGLIQTAAVTPAIRVADCQYNAQQCLERIREACAQGAHLVCLPELCLTGYTCGDLLLQSVLLDAAERALLWLARETAGLDALIAVGLPLRRGGKLYNCAAVMQAGKLLGIVPKTHLPNYAEFYELRHFSPAPAENSTITLDGSEIPFGTHLLFCCCNLPELCVGVELCEDLWAPLPPSTHHALAGATVILNLSASDELAGKDAYRRTLVQGQSARLLCGYVYADAGEGESTTDMVFAGHNLVAENGTLLAEAVPFGTGLALSEIDVHLLAGERLRNSSFAIAPDGYTRILFSLAPACTSAAHNLMRHVSAFPFVPQDPTVKQARCEAILTMQAKGLAKRMQHARCRTAVIGISGGLDSTLALLVIVRAFELLQLPLTDILAVTMPCFGTTQRTRSNASLLCEALGVTLREIPIADTVTQAFKDIGHDAAIHDVTYENTQARVRTLALMNLANKTGGLVVGTGDLSELALGWATYNGDHMSMYGVNGGVPKTLIRHLVAHAADESGTPALAQVLRDILDTPVSPELLPAENGIISQNTEDIVGPYELHDFFLYYAVRHAFAPSKIFFLARHAFDGTYDDATLLRWLENFYRRFFAQQFKRSCLPDGPKIGSVSLSPRGDWRMPSDACAALWLEEIARLRAESETA